MTTVARGMWLAIASLGLATALVGCNADENDKAPDPAPSGFGSIEAALRAPEDFQAPFCVRIEASGTDFAPDITSEDVYPAGTQVIETVLANIPVGQDRTVALGIFADGTCENDLETADWYGATGGVVIAEGEVTLVDIQLNATRGGGGNTGSVVIRTTNFSERRLHAEVVDQVSTPIPNALCRVYDGLQQVAAVSSGADPHNLGIVDEDLMVSPTAETLTLRCVAGNLQGTDEAEFDVDPADPSLGTFTSTVILKPGLEELESSSEGLRFRLNVSALPLAEAVGNGEVFQRFVAGQLPDGLALLSGQELVGYPEVPVYSAIVALPMGVDSPEDISIEAEGELQEFGDVLLYPIQPPDRAPAAAGEDPPSADFDEELPAFEFSRDVYNRGGNKLGDINEVTQMAHPEANLFRIVVPVVGYDPRAQRLSIPESLILDVRFPPPQGEVCFSRTRTVDPGSDLQGDSVERLVDELSPAWVESFAINSSILRQYYCPEYFFPQLLGARFVIVTDDAFLPAANSLRAHKQSQGISTIVVSTSSLSTGPVTKGEIRNYLFDAYNNWATRPKWVLLMGDAEFIPTHYGDLNFWDEARNAGDQYYGQSIVSGSLLDTMVPIFGIGRIPVDTNAQAQVVVDKIKAFETAPPTGFNNSFYSAPTFAAEFQDDDLNNQDDRWFAETTEHIRDYLLTEDITPTRIYGAPSSSNPTWWHDGGLVPPYLKKPGFPWDGNTTDIVDAVNAGTSILYHRNHGWWSGWGTPNFSTGNLGSINVTNNEYPVTYSINCASGIFDNETDDGSYGTSSGLVSWAETFVRQADGALAVIGDTRSSSTTANNVMAKGLFDATFPGYFHYPSGSMTSVRFLGDVLNHAKGFLANQGLTGADLRQEMLIYNLLGDPTSDVVTVPPVGISVENVFQVEQVLEFEIGCLTCPPFENLAAVVQVLDGEELGEVVGRAVVDSTGHGVVEVEGRATSLVLTVSGPGAVPVQLELDGPLPSNEPPEAVILTPAEDSGSEDEEYLYDGYDDSVGMWYKDIDVVALATDAEDGELPASAVRWTTDRTDIQDAGLGRGSSTTIRLYSDDCFGAEHTITLEVEDSDGNISTDVRRIVIWTLC
jgi:hypothetical protein